MASGDVPAASAALNQIGFLPRPDQVAAGSKGFAYFAAVVARVVLIFRVVDLAPTSLSRSDRVKPNSFAFSSKAKTAFAYTDLARRDRYLKFYGNTCTASSDQYMNFLWSSEIKL